MKPLCVFVDFQVQRVNSSDELSADVTNGAFLIDSKLVSFHVLDEIMLSWEGFLARLLRAIDLDFAFYLLQVTFLRVKLPADVVVVFIRNFKLESVLVVRAHIFYVFDINVFKLNDWIKTKILEIVVKFLLIDSLLSSSSISDVYVFPELKIKISKHAGTSSSLLQPLGIVCNDLHRWD